jgi:WD40 repeat protein
MAPDLPPHFVERPRELEALKRLLLEPDLRQPLATAAALEGAGGFGKTTLAAALCHDADILKNFADGLLWVRLGETSDVLRGLVTAYEALTAERPGFATIEEAAFQLNQKLEQRRCLLVIDDVWDAIHLRPFLGGGKGSARLFTTRNSEIAAEAQRVGAGPMREEESVALVGRSVPGLDPTGARELARRLADWPIALELARAAIEQRIERGDSLGPVMQRILQGCPAVSGNSAADRRQQILDAVLAESLALLDSDDQARLRELAIFPKDAAIPLAAAGELWNLSGSGTEATAQRLARLSLIGLSQSALGLHDVIGSWLAASLPNAAELHNRLIARWPDWMRLPHPYAWRWLPWHLAHARRVPDIERILWDPGWMHAKLRAAEPAALMADYQHLKPTRDTELVARALRLSCHTLARDPEQFASQMAGRLGTHQDSWVIRRFTGQLAAVAPEPWLRPMGGGLRPAHTALERTLEGHANYVYSVALTPDGRRAISASWDRTLKVWDLDYGQPLITLDGHTDMILGAAVTPDGRRAISASWDRTLGVWDLESGRMVLRLDGHTGHVNGVAVAPDGMRAVSASDDRTLKVWDLDSGCCLLTLQGHDHPVFGVAVTPDGKRAVSASWDHTLKVWDFERGQALRTLAGHTDAVLGVAVTPDGKRAISASWDRTLKLWDLDSGRAPLTLEGHADAVNGVAVTRDGRRAVSASDDRTLKVWDLDSGRALATLEGHKDPVLGVAVTPDGKRAVSASWDKTLRVWNLGCACPVRTPGGHAGPVSGVAVTADGKHTVSASWDHTLAVWDLDSRRLLRILEGHAGPVSAVAVTPDGQRAVSASEDRTLKVWDLDSGRLLRTLKGHSGAVFSVAVTPEGKRAISASADRTLKLWDLDSGRRLLSLEGHTNNVYGVAVTPHRKRAVSASADHTLKLWDLDSGRALLTLQGHANHVCGVVVTPDGKRAVSASADHTLKLWDLDSGRALLTLQGHAGWVNGVAAGCDGKRAVSASWDKTIKLWDLETGVAIATFDCDAVPQCCAFAGDRKIAAGDAGGQLHFLLIEERPRSHA